MNDKRLTFAEHLDELRLRLIRMFYGVAVAVFGCLYFARDIRQALLDPLVAVLPREQARTVALKIIDPILLDLKVAFIAGIFVASPWILYQTWAFVAPGLYPHERRWIWPFILGGTAFFVGGGLFAYYVALPAVFSFSIKYMGQDVLPMLDICSNLSLIATLILAFGLVFELPLVLFFLALLGVIRAEMLVRFRKYAIVAIFIIAGVVTPTPDALTQILMAVPMIVLYEMGIVGVKVVERMRRPRSAESGGAGAQNQ